MIRITSLAPAKRAQLHHEQADHAPSQDHDTVARTDLGLVDGMKAAGKRLAESAMHGIEIGGQCKCLPVRHRHIVGKPAIPCHADCSQTLAQIRPPARAGMTATAGDVGIDSDKLAAGKAYDVISYLFHDATEFMTHRHRDRSRILPLVHMTIGTADAGCKDANKQFAPPGNRFLDAAHGHGPDRFQTDSFHSSPPPR